MDWNGKTKQDREHVGARNKGSVSDVLRLGCLLS